MKSRMFPLMRMSKLLQPALCGYSPLMGLCGLILVKSELLPLPPIPTHHKSVILSRLPRDTFMSPFLCSKISVVPWL